MHGPTANLPGYAVLSPSYTPSPRSHEYRLALNVGPLPDRPSGEFVKQTKNGCASLRLSGQDTRASIPVYGLGASVEGIVEVHKSEGVTSVEVQVEGTLKLEQVAGGGTTTHKLCLCKSILWVRDRLQGVPCPTSLRFALSLPTTFSHDDKTYPLPPSYDAHLSGIPGFRTYIHYALSVMIVKPNNVSNMVKSTFLRKDDWAIVTPLLHYPRSRPSAPIPPPLSTNPHYGFMETPHWRVSVSTLPANRGGQDVMVKLYLPATRIFYIRQPIPFHLSFHSSSTALTSFIPLAPCTGPFPQEREFTRIQLMRQTAVDVRNAMVLGTKADIWRVDCIGEGAFKRTGDGRDWLAYSGEIFIGDHVNVGGFRAGGLSVRDCLVLSVNPSDLVKSSYKEMRMTVPVQLTTDQWAEDGSGLGAYGGSYGLPSASLSDELDTAREPRC